MTELKGKYNTAKIFTDNYDSETYNQVLQMCNLEYLKDAQIRIMPDCHAGKGCTIGTTIQLKSKKVNPEMVGVDIGCGMFVVKLGKKNIDLELFDKVCHENVASGRNVYEEYDSRWVDGPDAGIRLPDDLRSLKANIKSIDYIKRSAGSLGGGNHFIELDKDQEGNYYLVIHSGSRYLGIEVCKHYVDIAKGRKNSAQNAVERQELIDKMKKEGKQKDIPLVLKAYDETHKRSELYVDGADFDNYIHDMEIAQKFADISRKAIAMRIMHYYNMHIVYNMNFIHTRNQDDLLENHGVFTTIHNYIDTANLVVRKGAVAARIGEELIIPLNMRDGSLICKGKSNNDWNNSAPHGAGRILSRSKAKEEIKLEDFEKSMEGIYTTTVNKGTIDESPMAYKPMEDIIENIGGTAEIVERILPVYNFKASEEN